MPRESANVQLVHDRFGKRAPERPILAFAAVWDRWRPPDGAELRSLATVTCAPNAAVAAVHDRMPAILEPGDWAGWLGERDADPATMLRPFPWVLEVAEGRS